MHIPQTEVILRHEGSELVRVSLGPGEYGIGRGADADIRADSARAGYYSRDPHRARRDARDLDARQSAIDRTVAMKVMLEAGDEGDVLRFIDEAKITGQLERPNLVAIYELGLHA